MAVTPEEINNALAIISENLHALDKEQKKTARGFKELLVKKNVKRTPFYDAFCEALQQNGRVSVEEMDNFPAAPPEKQKRVYRKNAVTHAKKKLGVNIEREGNYYAIQEDLSEHVSWFLNKGNMNKQTFKLNCERRGVVPESMRAALKEVGVIFTKKSGEMKV